jgi:hypothetical protein
LLSLLLNIQSRVRTQNAIRDKHNKYSQRKR